MNPWHQKFDECLSRNGPGSYIIELPSYRPDLIADLAENIGCAFLDFRLQHLVPLGFQAHRLSLDAIETATEAALKGDGVVVQNGEALLAAKPAPERQAWIAAFLDKPRSYFVVLPLVLFGKEIPAHPRLVRFLASELPDETFFTQLASMRLTS